MQNVTGRVTGEDGGRGEGKARFINSLNEARGEGVGEGGGEVVASGSVCD